MAGSWSLIPFSARSHCTAPQVRQDLLNETIDSAVKEATSLLAKSANADDHIRLANDLLAELAKRPSASAGARSGGLS